MKKLLLTVLCAASVVLVGCQDNGNNPKEPEETTPVLTTKYYLNDSLLQYVDVTVVDSCHLELGNLPYTTAVLDTLVADAEFWKTLRFFYQSDKDLSAAVPVASIKVLTLTREITASGNYNNSIKFTRNGTAFHSATIGEVVAMSAYSTNWMGKNYVSATASIKVNNLMPVLALKQYVMKVDVTF